MREIRTLLLLALLAAPAWAADPIEEREPNDDRKTATQELRPGQTLAGTFTGRSDIDGFVLVVDEPRVLTLTWRMDAKVGLSKIRLGSLLQKGGSAPVDRLVLHRYLVPAGRHHVEIGGRASGGPSAYRVTVRVEPETPGLAVEPDERVGQAPVLGSGESLTGYVSHPIADIDKVRLKVPRRGVYRLVADRLDVAEDPGPVTFSLMLAGADGARYVYEVDTLDREFDFFPILDGEHALTVKHRKGAVESPYRLRLEPFEVAVSPETEARARAAIDRALVWLLDRAHEEAPRKHEVAVLSTELMALVEGSGAADRAADRRRRSDEIIAALAKRTKPLAGGSWRGEPVAGPSDLIYDLAFAVLALSEATVAEHEGAAELTTSAMRALLASQQTGRRCEAWGPTAKGDAHHGGWRYGPKDKGADLSVTGWCLIAIYAGANAGIEVPGMVQAADDALEFVRRCARLDGFRYQPTVRGGRPTSVLQGIGALVGRLFGQGGPFLRAAEIDIDHHLPAGTQTGFGNNAPLYYWYYATRACWLRGGYAWAAWRAVLLEQLLRRQQDDGSWIELHEERIGGRRFATAMGVLLLRLALEEPPAYLSNDVEGF